MNYKKYSEVQKNILKFKNQEKYSEILKSRGKW